MATWIAFQITPAEFSELVELAICDGDVYFLPDRFRQATVPQYRSLRDVPQRAWCYAWDMANAAAPQVKKSDVGDYYIRHVDGVHVACGTDDLAGNVRGRIELDEYALQASRSYTPFAASTLNRFKAMSDWIKKHCRFVPEDHRYLSRRALEALLATGQAPEWAEAAEQRWKSRGRQPMVAQRRSSYKASFRRARDEAGLEGELRPKIGSLPRYREDKFGPSLFRSAMADKDLRSLTLPGLYIGRSDLREVDCSGSDLHLSAVNWSDFEDCDFSRCDLSRCDLRGCNFENCQFTETDLSGADLRNSGFRGCDFAGATLAGATLLTGQKDAITLTEDQATAVKWTDDYEEPEGG